MDRRDPRNYRQYTNSNQRSQYSSRMNKKDRSKMIVSLTFILVVICAFLFMLYASGNSSPASTGNIPENTDPTAPETTLNTNSQIPASTEPSTPTAKVTKVIIDPGHGGFDVGTEGSGNYKNEDDLNLAISLKLGNELQAMGITPIFTRSDENAVGNTKELDMANRIAAINSSGAVLEVSIHMNSFATDSSVKGPEVYYYEGNANSSESMTIASILQTRLNSVSGGKRSYKHGDFMVIRDVNIPAVLVECGFLSNSSEEQQLNSEEYQTQLARAIAEGIIQYLS